VKEWFLLESGEQTLPEPHMLQNLVLVLRVAWFKKI
jgi:hypothetical protein